MPDGYQKIGVLGAGIMGSGIAQICAEAGYEVVLVDIAEAFVNKGFQGIVKIGPKQWKRVKGLPRTWKSSKL